MKSKGSMERKITEALRAYQEATGPALLAYLELEAKAWETYIKASRKAAEIYRATKL